MQLIKDLTKNNDVSQDIEHHKAMISAYRKRLRILELQEAQQGITTPPHVPTEISALKDKIDDHTKEASKLQTASVSDKFTVQEAEYRMALAQAWDNRHGRLRLIDLTMLELKRLNLGIALQKSQEMEQEVRSRLALESFWRFDGRFQSYFNTIFPSLSDKQPDEDLISTSIIQRVEDQIYVIGRAIRLNTPICVDFILKIAPKDLDVERFDKLLRVVNQTWIYEEDNTTFDKFTALLKEKISNANTARPNIACS